MLAEDERIFRDSVREFAEAQVRPLVREMDEHAKIPRALIDELFELGVMGIEVPERYGGAGGTLLPLGPGRRGAVARRPVGRRARRRPEHAGHQRAAALGQRRHQAALPARDWPPSTVGAYALSEAGSGSDAFALTTRAREDGDGYVLNGRKLWITNGNEADLFIVFATVNPEAGYRGITAFLVERGFPASRSARRKTSSASARAARAS